MSVTPQILSRPVEAATAPRTGLPWLNWALLLGAGILAFRPTAITWGTNPNYSYGWWIPLVCVFLFAERWPMRPSREPSGLGMGIFLAPVVILWGAIFFAFRLAAEADPSWRPGLWVLAGLYIAALLGWLRLYGGRGWLRHFAFPVCFLLLSLPWLFAIELPLVQGLMRWNASLAAGSLRMLGIPAIAEGNVIDLANGRLGVEEACSGILSLQSSLMLGCLLGEIYRLGAGRRVLLVLLTMGLALSGNYVRTLFLALLAAFNGGASVAAWHDTAGYSILLLSGAGSWLACLYLRHDRAPYPVTTAGTEQAFSEPWRPAQLLALSIFVAAAVSEAGTQAWFGWKEAEIPHHPEWTVQFPQIESFKAETLAQTTREALFCDAYQAGSWRDGRDWSWTAYWFRYDPKPSNQVVLGWHNPDNCLPSVGLKKDEDYPDFTAKLNGLDLYVQPKRFSTSDKTIYLFWLIYPLSGSLPPIIENDSNAPIESKFRTHLADVWRGYRGVGVETLEVAVAGPTSYDAAREAYLQCLQSMAKPKAPENPL